MSVEKLHAMIAHACLGAVDENDLGRDLEAYLERHDLDADDRAAILASPRRLGLYRRLVRHNVVNVIGQMLGDTRARLGAEAFDRTVDAFLADRGPRTPHLRDVPNEFLSWARPRWSSLVADHATYELASFTVGVAPRAAPPPPLADVTADRALVFGEPKLLVHLAHTVHEDPVAERPTTLLVYRDAEHQTRFLDLSPAAAAILERLFAGLPLAQAMVQACSAIGIPLDDNVLAGAALLLSDLGERGVLLGARE